MVWKHLEKELNIFMGSRKSVEPDPDSSMEEVMSRPRAMKIWLPRVFNSSQT